MNPIVYNKNGQYRFTDFVGYLPEFLHSEPDVVTFLQVMSDYINNAYRNVEVTDEFELMKVCSSSDCSRVMRMMESLCGMFRLACDRGELVMYLSVPRNNIKNNDIVGNENAEYVREIEVDLDKIEDSISMAKERMGGDGGLDDGDIVYVKYRKMTPVQKVAYYYVKDSNILVKDPMCASQDPFTDTYNDPATALQFKVLDVGNVIRRYGGKKNTVVFYEVYFTIKLSNIERVASTGVAKYDVDMDGVDDDIYVDYYNLSNATGDMYNTYIKFAGKNGFGWTGEFPGGMFYFRDSSAAKLTNISSDNTMELADTMMSPSVDKYRITRIERTSGMYKVYTEVFPGIYENALFYIMKGTTSLGLYKMNGSVDMSTRFDEGEAYINLINVSGIDYHIESETGLTLVSIPLAQSKFVIDYDSALPTVRWSDEITNLNNTSIGLSTDVLMHSVDLVDNAVLYQGKVYQTGIHQFRIAGNCDAFKEGERIMSSVFYNMTGGEVIRPVIAKVTNVNMNRPEGYTTVTLDTPIFTDQSELENVTIYDVSAGYIKAVDEEYYDDTANYAYLIADWNTKLNEGDIIEVPVKVDNDTVVYKLLTVTNVNDDSKKFQVKVPTGFRLDIPYMSPIIRVVDAEDSSRINKFNYVRSLGNGITLGAVSKQSYKGDIFTPKYMLASLKTKMDEPSLLVMYTDVVKSNEVEYQKGQYVYIEPNVYRVVKTVEITQDDMFTTSNAFAIDRIAHYSVGYKEITNSYMPYSGPVSTLDYEEKPNYSGDMSIVRVPLYIKKVNDVRLKYGWEQREYVYYNDGIGVDSRARSGFIEVYSGNENSPVDVDLTKGAYSLSEPALLYGCGSRYYQVDIDSNPTAIRNADGSWTVTIKSSGHNLPDGSTISAIVEDTSLPNYHIFNTESAKITVLSSDVFQYDTHYDEATGVTATFDKDDLPIKYDRAYNHEPDDDDPPYPNEGDLVMVGSTLYQVHSGAWSVISPNAIITPTTIYSRHNLFDTSVTNPVFALGDDNNIKEISIDGMEEGVARVFLTKRIAELDRNPSVYDGKGRVFIQYVNQGAFNGWHTIKTVHNGGMFDIYYDPREFNPSYPITNIHNRKMTAYMGRWFKYTLYGYDWDKKSNQTTYITSNSILEQRSDNPRIIKAKYAHNLSVGDNVIVDRTGTYVYSIDSSTSQSAIEDNLFTTKVVTVIDANTVELADTLPDNYESSSIYKGYIITNGNLKRLNGEYPYKLDDGKIVKFVSGDVVIPLKQVCLDEIHGWRVAENAWIPLKDKRTFKIDKMTVDMVHNEAFDGADDYDADVEYRYVTYSDADVYADTGALLIDYANARNYHFEHPYVEHLDTTQNVELEYSSKYDYASVAPRDDMDSTFKGVPDMGYPLAERIERLAYLRDANVIDIDLIGYLARFMGYDITALADDIRSSNVYRNSIERESAVRETIAHLPQFYALNGTKPGINMLMATFGLVGDLVTMWTRTDDPYAQLVRQDEVGKKIDEDLKNGNTSVSWVPTPHVQLDIIENESFNSMLMATEEITRMKEQIRRCKPINVVFDGIRVLFNTSVNSTAVLNVGGASAIGSTVFMSSEDEPIEIDRDPCMSDDCSF